MTEVSIPDFQKLLRPRSCDASPDFFTNEERDMLRREITGRGVTSDHKEFFLDQVAMEACTWRAFSIHERTNTEIREKISAINMAIDNFRRELGSIGREVFNQMSSEFDCLVATDLSYHESIPLEFQDTHDHFGRLLTETLDATRLIQETGEFTIERLVSSRGDERPAIHNRQELVLRLARAYWIVFGAWPSTSRGAWFNSFVRVAGEVCQAGAIGEQVVRGAVAEFKGGKNHHGDWNGSGVLMCFLLGSDEMTDAEKCAAFASICNSTAKENHAHLMRLLSRPSAS